eukprot:s234_g27.t1
MGSTERVKLRVEVFLLFNWHAFGDFGAGSLLLADAIVYGGASVANGIGEGWGCRAATPGTSYSIEVYRVRNIMGVNASGLRSAASWHRSRHASSWTLGDVTSTPCCSSSFAAWGHGPCTRRCRWSGKAPLPDLVPERPRRRMKPRRLLHSGRIWKRFQTEWTRRGQTRKKAQDRNRSRLDPGLMAMASCAAVRIRLESATELLVLMAEAHAPQGADVEALRRTAGSGKKLLEIFLPTSRPLRLRRLETDGSEECYLDPIVARTMRDIMCDVITLEVGINIQTTAAMTRRVFRSAFEGFVETLRDGHPKVPIVVISPLWYGPLEDRGLSNELIAQRLLACCSVLGSCENAAASTPSPQLPKLTTGGYLVDMPGEGRSRLVIKEQGAALLAVSERQDWPPALVHQRDEFVFICSFPGVWGRYTDGRVVFNNGTVWQSIRGPYAEKKSHAAPGDEVVSTVCDLVVVQPGPCTVTLDVGGPGSICASLSASDSGGIVPKGAAWTCRWPDCGILSLLPGEPPQQESGFKQRFAIHGQTNKFVPEAQRPGLASPGPGKLRKLAEELGLLALLPEHYEFFSEAKYPCILKPAIGTFGKNTHIVESKDQAMRLAPDGLDEHWVLQELIVGEFEYSTSLLVHKGEIFARLPLSLQYN